LKKNQITCMRKDRNSSNYPKSSRGISSFRENSLFIPVELL
jgi:hypothetical protein